MAHQLSISIPEELYARIQKVKNTFKVSRVCQAAIEDAVALEEARGGDDINILVDRLKMEKSEAFKPYWNEGFKDGKVDAMSFTFSNFMEFIKIVGENCDNPDRLDAFYESYFLSDDHTDKGNYFIQGGKLPIEDVTKIALPRTGGTEEGGAYADGWINGVFFVWEQVKGKI